MERFIYNSDAYESFHEKLDEFHDNYVYHLILNGVAPKGTDLESIKMTKNPNVNYKYCRRIVGGFKNIKPEVSVSFFRSNEELSIECLFTRINDNELINHTFMLQSVMDWPQDESFSCQVWYLGDVNMNQIKNFWNN